MKNAKPLLRHVMALAFLTLIFFSCNEAKKEKPEPDVVEPKEVEAPEGIISLEEADVIYNNYTKHRIPAIENYETRERAPSEKFQAARFVDFDYDTMKEYIKYVDQEAEKAGVKKVTKLRLYFANYPDKEEFPDRKKVIHPRQNSIFMLPTLEQDNGNYGFYIGEDGKAKLIKDWKTGQVKGMGTLQTQANENHASLVPNFFSSSTLQGGKSLTMNRSGSGPPPHGDF